MADGRFPTLVSRSREVNSATHPIFVQLTDGTDSSLIDGSGNLQVILAANDGVDIGDVTINNDIFAADAAALPAEGMMIITDDGTDSHFLQSNAAGDLKVTLDSEEIEVTLNGETVGLTNDPTHLEDAAHASGDRGSMALAVRNDTLASLVDADGDYSALQVDALGALYVSLNGEALNVDIGQAEDSAHSSGDEGVQMLAVRSDAGGSLVDADNDYAPLQVTASGDLRVTLDDEALNLDIGQTEDAAHSSGDEGVMTLAVRNDTASALVDADGDYAPLQVNADGDLRVSLDTERVEISATQAANSETNPIYVQTVETGLSATEVHDYDVATVASDSSANHDYTITGSNFLLRKIICSASGAAKFEVQSGPIASLATNYVLFIPDTGGSLCCDVGPAIETPATGTGTIRVVKSNRENQGQDLYTTIIGNDIP